MTDQMQTLDGYISLNDAAKRAELSPGKLRDLAATGQIDARKVAGRWLIHADALPGAKLIISTTSRKPGQGARIEQKIDSLEYEITVLVGTVDMLHEQISNFTNVVARNFSPAIHGTIESSEPEPAEYDADRDGPDTSPPVLSSVHQLADQIIADQSSIAAMEQVERADRDLRVNGFIH